MGMAGNEKQHSDIIDFLTDACQIKQIVIKDGKEVLELILDEKRVWWKTLTVNSPHLGRFAKMLEDYAAMAINVYNVMPLKSANVISKQIERDVRSYALSLDSLSSVTYLDRNNRQPSLIDRILKNKSERVVNIREDQKSKLAELFGQKSKEEAIRDY